MNGLSKKELSLKKKLLILGCLMILEILIFLIVSNFYEVKKQKRPYATGHEFVMTIDCAEIFDSNPNKKFVISFEIRADKAGEILVYQQNGSTARYAFYEYIDVTEDYQKFDLVVSPKLSNEYEEQSMLAFYGVYGSGVIPEVKNISVSVYEE